MTATKPEPTPAPLTMADRIAAELEADPLAHEWIVAAEIPIDTKTAKRAVLRHSYRTEGGEKIDALEVYCRRCARPIDEVAGRDCEVKVDNTHRIGGNPGERAKRKVGTPVGRIEIVPLTPRRQMQYGGYSVHAQKV